MVVNVTFPEKVKIPINHLCMILRDHRGSIQWNLGITNGQGTGKICSLYRGTFYIFYYYWGKENRSLYRGFRQKSFVISGFRQKRSVIPRFSSEEVRYTEVFVRRGSLYRGFRQKRFVISRFQFTDSEN